MSMTFATDVVIDSSHKISLQGLPVYYGTCSTAAGTAAKVVTCAGFTLAAGELIWVKFTNANTYTTLGSLTMNVNSTGAKSIKKLYNGAVENITSAAELVAGIPLLFAYNGTNWVLIGSDFNDNLAKLGQGYGVCETAASTKAKVSTITDYTLQTNGIVAIKFTYAVPATATLNISSKGAKSINYQGAAIVAGIIRAGDTATFMYDGTVYNLLSVDSASKPITNAEIDTMFS